MSKKRLSFRKYLLNKPASIVSKHKKAHELGQEHINSKGKLIPVKKIVSKKAAIKCKFNYTKKLIEKHRRAYSWHFFIAQATVCPSVAGTKKRHMKSNYTYSLMKEEDSFRVWKSFYMSTLKISQKIVDNVYQQNNKLTDKLKPDGKGKHDKHTKMIDEQKNGVISHTDSFPVVESHNCRAKTNKYLEAGLNIQKMFDL